MVLSDGPRLPLVNNQPTYCVGGMSWPTVYPTRVGTRCRALGAGGDLRRSWIYKKVDHLASERSAYFGAAFGIPRELRGFFS